MASDPQEPARLGVLSSRYSLLLCDIWGVVHNGVAAHASAVEALRRHREAGGAVVLISNAPRPGAAVAQLLEEMHVPGEAYDAIVTSGDVTRGILSRHRGGRVHHLGPARDHGVFEGLALDLCAPQEAELVLCTGLVDDDSETPDDYVAMFEPLVARRVPMLCANPDIVVERGDRLVYCAGALAERYVEIGGSVIWAGKPHKPIYDAAMTAGAEALGRVPSPDEVLAIGDSVRTDLSGAAAQGFAMLFITGGIHAGETAALEDQFAALGAWPVGMAPQLVW
jgi:HAD superfamily hydrolase (TIGR01459 family)